MTRMGMLVGGVVLATLAAAGASAQDRAARLSRNALVKGDLVTAERVLLAERRIFPDRVDVLLNLAAAYRVSGRDSAAAPLYARVLDQPDVAMNLNGGRVASSHDIARLGLERVGAVVTAAR